MEVKCDYCGGMMDDRQDNCPHCGASNVHIKRTADNTPQTIEELKDWYKAMNLPPSETTRFFIGIDYKEPRAFGIYKDGNEYIVYKNKDDGSRAIRYRGTDEGYAVNELYLKLKSEILHQKSMNSQRRSSTKSNSIGTKITSSPWKTLIIAFVIMVAFSGIVDTVKNFFAPKPTYYRYNDAVYCEYDDNYYLYSDYDYIPISDYSMPEEVINNGPDYEFDSSDVQWKSGMNFESSDYYDDHFSSSDSDSSWDSGDSWDSGGSDWGSDW